MRDDLALSSIRNGNLDMVCVESLRLILAISVQRGSPLLQTIFVCLPHICQHIRLICCYPDMEGGS